MRENFVEMIQRLMASGEIKRGAVYHMDVKHDDHCPTLRTQRIEDCTCNPDYELAREDDACRRVKR